MANSYAWAFPVLETAPQIDDHADVVVTVHWQITASDALEHAASQSGQLTITFDPQAPFTPFAELTAEIVEGWVESNADTAQIKAALDAALARLAPAPTLVPMPPPWGD